MSADPTDRTDERAGYALAGVLAGGFVIFAVPGIAIGAVVGGLVGATVPWKVAAGKASKARWRRRGQRTVAYGFGLVGAYLLMGGTIGVDIQQRRFGRKWSLGDPEPTAFAAHPWAWLPIAVAAAACCWGALVWWRSR